MFDSILLILFVCFVVALILLDIAMVISLVRSGDERRQLMIWKASTFTLIGTVCVMIIDVVKMFIDPSTISNHFPSLALQPSSIFAAYSITNEN